MTLDTLHRLVTAHVYAAVANGVAPDDPDFEGQVRWQPVPVRHDDTSTVEIPGFNDGHMACANSTIMIGRDSGGEFFGASNCHGDPEMFRDVREAIAFALEV